jgi:two-component system chemotaxis response regulator CheB
MPGPSAVVADDSHFMRSVISDLLTEGGIDVVAQARNGREAVEAVATHRPDVVTMDIEMPELNGIEATAEIMAATPTPVLILSAHADDDTDVTFRALEEGAVDFFTKPGGEVSMEMSRLKDQLVEMVRSVAAVDVSGRSERTTTSGRSTRTSSTPSSGPSAGSPAAGATYVDDPTLVIGSSTGGPNVVEEVMSGLAREAGFRVLVVQHMPEGFTGRFADRIDARSEYDVREASDGDRIGGGEALVAPGGRHMEVANDAGGRLRVRLTDDPPVNNVRPAVDVTMRTAAQVVTGPMTGVILTGMGRDGAEGIATMKAAGASTIAQSEATCAVYGMPKMAVETGQVDRVCDAGDVAGAVLETVRTEVSHQ